MSVKSLFIFLIFVFHEVQGNSSGAPDSVCTDDSMMPNHFGDFETTPSPFSVTVDSCDGTHCYITIAGTEKFKGIFMRAVDTNDHFLKHSFDLGSSAATTKLMCSGSAVTQNEALHVDNLQVKWVIHNYCGNVTFRATVLKSFSTFWNVKSDVVTLSCSQTSLTSTQQTTERNPLAFSTPKTARSSNNDHVKACPSDKSCFLCPDRDRCVITWSPGKDNYVDFQISASTADDSRYIAMAFSLDDQMGDDSIVLCSKQQTAITAELWYSERKSIRKVSRPTLSLDASSIGGVYSDGWMTCKFSKEVKSTSATPSNELVYYLDGSSYYLLFATGNVRGGQPGKHDHAVSSESKINFVGPKVTAYGSSLSAILVKSHGILMVIAWLIFASIGILLPRYFKSAWPNAKILKKPLWFMGHQGFMLSVSVLTVIAFVIIFSEVRGYVQSTDGVTLAHPPLGIIVMVLVVLNPVMALFRCDPDHRNRWIFNFFHAIFGEFVLVIAVVNIFLSFYIPKANVPYWVQWVMVALVSWHVFVELLLLLHDRYLQSRLSKEASREHRNSHVLELDESLPRGSNQSISSIKSALIVSQFVVVLGLAVAICVGIGRG